MSAISDALLELTDPITVLGFTFLAYYMRQIDFRHAKRLEEIQDRIERLENHGYFTDGGEEDGEKNS